MLVCLLFIIYINDRTKGSGFLGPIMFTGDTHLLYSNNNIEHLFLTMNKELNKLVWCELFVTEYLHIKLNIVKLKYSGIFAKVILDKNPTCRYHINTKETKTLRSII